MDDQEKQTQKEQKKFGDHLREVASISKIRERLRRRQYRVKQGNPPPKPPPYCPHWHRARPKPQKAWTKVGTERLRVYEGGYVSRLERYEERLLNPTSKEARQKAKREAGYSSTATTLCGAPVNPEAELVEMFERLRELERLYELSDDDDGDDEEEEEGAGARQEQSEEDRAEMHWDESSSTEGSTSWARSLGTVSLKGEKFEEVRAARIPWNAAVTRFWMGMRRAAAVWQTFSLAHPPTSIDCALKGMKMRYAGRSHGVPRLPPPTNRHGKEEVNEDSHQVNTDESDPLHDKGAT